MKYTTLFTRASVGFLAFVLAFYWLKPVYADYTIVLKNNGRITVENYWEERGMVRFRGLGGEIGINNAFVQSIVPSEESSPPGIVIGKLNKLPSPKPRINILNSDQDPVAIPTGPEPRSFGEKEKEQEEYQSFQGDLTDAIKSSTHRYWQITRRTTDPEPIILEDTKGRTIDHSSRRKDAQYYPEKARGTGIVNLITNSAFAGQKQIIGLRHKGVIGSGRVTAKRVNAARVGILPRYTRSEMELSNLRNHKDLFYQERENLMEGIESKSIFSGAPPYEAYPSVQPQWWRDRYGRER